jgi:hypothetical protein
MEVAMNWLLIVGIGVVAAGSLCSREGRAQDAAFSGYKCNIKHSQQLEKDGSLQPSSFASTYKEFVVDRASGRMLGGTASGVWKYAVWDRGSDQQSFKAVYTSQGPYLHVQFLEIREFVEGAAKPFVLTDGMYVHTGLCAHLN